MGGLHSPKLVSQYLLQNWKEEYACVENWMRMWPKPQTSCCTRGLSCMFHQINRLFFEPPETKAVKTLICNDRKKQNIFIDCKHICIVHNYNKWYEYEDTRVSLHYCLNMLIGQVLLSFLPNKRGVLITFSIHKLENVNLFYNATMQTPWSWRRGDISYWPCRWKLNNPLAIHTLSCLIEDSSIQ